MRVFKGDFKLSIEANGDADNFMLLHIEDLGNGANGKMPSKSVPIEHATPELIGKAIAEYINENCCEDAGWTVVFYPWDDDCGKPRVAGRFKTTEEKDKFIKEINSPDSGWTNEELQSVSVINDYWYMLPV